jgi:cytochrome c-type biogenesis protein CcmH
MSWLSTLRRPANLVALVILVAVGIVWAVTAIQAAHGQTLDQRTHDVAVQLQCPVCNGESVADAPSPVALEMRAVIRQKLAAGASEQEVLDYFEAKYGPAILESPPKQGFTWLIWLAPVIMFLAGIVLVVSVGREWRAAVAAQGLAPGEDADTMDTSAMTDDDRERYRRLLQRELDADEGLATDRGYRMEGV